MVRVQNSITTTLVVSNTILQYRQDCIYYFKAVKRKLSTVIFNFTKVRININQSC